MYELALAFSFPATTFGTLTTYQSAFNGEQSRALFQDKQSHGAEYRYKQRCTHCRHNPLDLFGLILDTVGIET